MSINLGDYEAGASNLNFKFYTKSPAGMPSTLGGSPVISVYKANESGTEKTSAESYISLTVDFDSITGLNHVEIDLSGDPFFAFGEDYQVVITTGTVGPSVAGTVVASFSIGRDATNIWDRILTGATHDIANSGGKRLRQIQELLPTALVAGRMDSNLGSIDGDEEAARNFEQSASVIVTGTCDATVTPTKFVFEADDILEPVAGHFNGRIIIFTSGPLNAQATVITNYELNGGRGRFTVVALTAAPGNNDEFVIV